MTALFTHPVWLVALGGAAGSAARYGVSELLKRFDLHRPFPLATFAVNVTGAFLLGFVTVWCLERLDPPRRSLYLLLGTGFCGGYTTFSTFKYESLKLLQDGRAGLVFANLMVSVAAGFLAVWLGVKLARK